MSDVFPFNLPMGELKRFARLLKAENKMLPVTMTKMPTEKHADQTARSNGRLIEVWRSRNYLCQIYSDGGSEQLERLSVCRAEIDTTNRRWRDGLSWDELMRVKREVGYGNFDAVEAYPRDIDIVNVANLRHLFIFREPVPWIWRKG